MAASWLSHTEKARLLEATVHVDAVMYVGTGCAPLYADRVKDYVLQNPTEGWLELFYRANVYRDEGYAVKLIRDLYALEKLDLEPEFRLFKKDFHTAFAAGEGNLRTLKRVHLIGASWAETPDGIKAIIIS